MVCITLSCKQSAESSSEQGNSVSAVLNMNNQEISVDSINSFVESKMAELQIPGLSYAIINDGKRVYHDVKG